MATRMTPTLLSSTYDSTSSPTGTCSVGPGNWASTTSAAVRRRLGSRAGRRDLRAAASGARRAVQSFDEQRADRRPDAGRRRRCPIMAAATAIGAGARSTPAASNCGAKASPVAGPPVSVTDPHSTPNSGGCPMAHRRRRRRRRSAARRRWCSARRRAAPAARPSSAGRSSPRSRWS